MTDDQYTGPWAAVLTQVGDVYLIEIQLPHPIDGERVSVIVKGVGRHTAVEVKPWPNQEEMPS